MSYRLWIQVYFKNDRASGKKETFYEYKQREVYRPAWASPSYVNDTSVASRINAHKINAAKRLEMLEVSKSNHVATKGVMREAVCV